MNSHSLTNFTVSRNHVTTTVSHREVLLFCTRDFCRNAQNFGYPSEFGISLDTSADEDADAVLHYISCASVDLPFKDQGKTFSSYP